MDVSNKILSDITVHMKYARYLEHKQRRENWGELVTRNMQMHIKKYPSLEAEIVEAYQYDAGESDSRGQALAASGCQLLPYDR